MKYVLLIVVTKFIKKVFSSDQIIGNYTVIETMSKKENHVILKAFKDDVYYSIKVYDYDFSINNEKLIKNEETRHKCLNHPNIITFIEKIILNKHQICFVYEYAECVKLDYTFSTLDEFKSFIKQISIGLYYLKTKNLIHNSLKLDNIVKVGNIYKITNFLYSKRFNPRPNVGYINLNADKYKYLAPELFKKHVRDHKSDIFSLGVLAKRRFEYNLNNFEDLKEKEKQQSICFFSKLKCDSVKDRYTIEEVLLDPWFDSLAYEIPNLALFLDMDYEDEIISFKKRDCTLSIYNKKSGETLLIAITQKEYVLGCIINNNEVEMRLNGKITHMRFLEERYICILRKVMEILSKNNLANWEICEAGLLKTTPLSSSYPLDLNSELMLLS